MASIVHQTADAPFRRGVFQSCRLFPTQNLFQGEV